MSASITRNLVLIAAAALTLPVMLSMPALASPKRTGITQSLAGIVKSHDDYCSSIRGEMLMNQDLAEAAVDAKQDPTPYSNAADAAQEQGEGAGCAWAL